MGLVDGTAEIEVFVAEKLAAMLIVEIDFVKSVLLIVVDVECVNVAEPVNFVEEFAAGEVFVEDFLVAEKVAVGETKVFAEKAVVVEFAAVAETFVGVAEEFDEIARTAQLAVLEE